MTYSSTYASTHRTCARRRVVASGLTHRVPRCGSMQVGSMSAFVLTELATEIAAARHRR